MVFNRFWRADPARARTTGGTGLGLVDLARGRPAARRPAPGVGAPRRRRPVPADPPATRRRPDPAQPAAAGARRRTGRPPMKRVLVALLAVLLLATGCSLLPTSGVVHREADAGRVSPNDTAQFAPPGPGKGDSPTQVVKGFLLAMTAVPLSTSVARSFLTAAAQPAWNPNRSTVVYQSSAIDLVPDGVRVTLGDAQHLDSRGGWLGGVGAGNGRLDLRLVRDERGVADRQPAGRRRGAGVVPRQPVRPGQPLLLRPDQPGARARTDLPPARRAARVHPGAGAAGRAGRRARRGDSHRLPARHPARPVRAGRARRDGRGAVERGGAGALADEDDPRGRAAGVDAAPGARADPDPDHLRRRPGVVARRPPRLQRPGGRRVRPDRARRLRPAVRRGQGPDRGRPAGEHGAGAGPVRPARLLAAVDRRLRRRVPDRRGGR